MTSYHDNGDVPRDTVKACKASGDLGSELLKHSLDQSKSKGSLDLRIGEMYFSGL